MRWPRETEAAEALRERLALLFQGETLRETGDRLGVTPVAVHHWREADRAPSFAVLNRIVRAYGVRAEWLLMGEGPMRAEPAEPAERTEDAA